MTIHSLDHPARHQDEAAQQLSGLHLAIPLQADLVYTSGKDTLGGWREIALVAPNGSRWFLRVDNNGDLYTETDSPIDSQMAYLKGKSTFNELQEAYLIGQAEALSSTPSSLTGEQDDLDGQSAFLQGETTALDNQASYLEGN
jgi:hypothetical protein